MRKYSTEQITVAIIITLGIIASLIQFIYNPSFWQDEASLALNIIHRNSFDLLKPLDYGQVAPILFLQIEKLFSTILPNTEYGLRLFPLLCFWGAIFLFFQIIKKQLDSVYARIAALSLFVFGFIFIYYATEVKQYMSDVFVLLCVFYFLLKDYKRERNKYRLLGIVGITAVFLSNVAPIILFTGGVYLVCENFSQLKKRIVPLFFVFAVWLSTFILYYCLFIYKHPSQELMVKSWLSAFLPSNPFTSDFYVFLFEKVPITILFSAIFNLNVDKIQTKIVALLFAILLIAGIIYLIRRKNVKILIISCVPVLLHLLLSSFQLYPFATRLILYTLPGIILVCSFGFDCILNVVFPKLKIEKIKPYVLVLFVLISCVQLFARLPNKKLEVKECLNYVQNNPTIDNNVYSFLYASIVLQYYKDIRIVSNEINVIPPLDFERYMMGDEYLQSDLYITDLQRQLRGKKVWLLISAFDGEDFILGKIDSLGYKRIKAFKTKGASIYLYDFGK
jgi:hypothetical protein